MSLIDFNVLEFILAAFFQVLPLLLGSSLVSRSWTHFRFAKALRRQSHALHCAIAQMLSVWCF